MIFAAQAVQPPPVAVNTTAIESRRTIKGDGNISPGSFRTSCFKQRVFAWEGGKYSIRLSSYPLLRIDPNSKQFTVEGWDVSFSMGEAPQLPRLLVRRFLSLWNKAQRDDLTDSEANAWLHIVDNVDMSAFARQRARPRYVEGQLLARTDFLRVKWHDGTEERINLITGTALEIVDVGEHFGAFVKLGPSNATVAIEDVAFIQPESTANT